ncbi:MAG: Stealth CR1 domain-containing protein [Natronospirillum sp.]|uniref:Stealth CR1 domain-containing protein n=1 Tax=Natronospirillum sp. TaxID=2812955 RepID=UPI0025F22B66|nr:Stealth CR1 domain-containing protein [Natronospirillum sp.]MCH8553483.1 Stealth CR1 domain-containing protein [Natronospirillum sp.]
MNSPIDAVITWVDGDDPAHREKLNRYLETLGYRPRMAGATRFREVGEFAYCIASLLRFAPWLRRIHIITDGQTPAFWSALQQTEFADRVCLVDHQAVFAGYEHCLPTFNARTLNSVIWRVPGLAEQFLYLNDDFVLLRDVQATDFFREGRPVIRGGWRLQPHRQFWGQVRRLLKGRSGKSVAQTRPGYREAQAQAAQLAGFEHRYFRTPHNPHPLRRSTMERLASEHPERFANNLTYRLRSAEQFLMDAWARHDELYRGEAIIDNRLGTLRLKPDQYGYRALRYWLWQADWRSNVAFGCVQSLDRADDRNRALIMEWLERRIGPLPW